MFPAEERPFWRHVGIMVSNCRQRSVQRKMPRPDGKVLRGQIQELLVRQGDRCAKCDGSLKWGQPLDPKQASLDRINNNRGYVCGNMRLVHIGCQDAAPEQHVKWPLRKITEQGQICQMVAAMRSRTKARNILRARHHLSVLPVPRIAELKRMIAHLREGCHDICGECHRQVVFGGPPSNLRASVDRLDNWGGYVAGNVRLVHAKCNRIEAYSNPRALQNRQRPPPSTDRDLIRAKVEVPAPTPILMPIKMPITLPLPMPMARAEFGAQRPRRLCRGTETGRQE